MKFYLSTASALCVTTALFSVAVNADNIPNLCTDDIVDLVRIKPSTASGLIPPNITVGGETYNGDADHFVINAAGTADYKPDRIMIYLPGTTDRPELSSCLLKSISESRNIPTVGLSYAYLSSGDSFRNGKCKALFDDGGTIDDQVNCLTEQHKDAIDGGDFGATHSKAASPDVSFWDEVKPNNSITARLGYLMKYLDTQHPEQGYKKFYDEPTDSLYPVPKWQKFVVMGHSQGAGHAAYLAQTRKISGAIMVSGPQDECIDCDEGTDFWIDGSYPTKRFTAFASADEPLVGVMKDNWSRMTTRWTKDPIDIGFSLKADKSACEAPILTSIKYANTSTCGGKEHCSTAIDDSVPFIEQTDGSVKTLYSYGVWKSLVKGLKQCS